LHECPTSKWFFNSSLRGSWCCHLFPPGLLMAGGQGIELNEAYMTYWGETLGTSVWVVIVMVQVEGFTLWVGRRCFSFSWIWFDFLSQEVDLSLSIMLLQPPQCSGYSCVPPCSAHHSRFDYTLPFICCVTSVSSLNSHCQFLHQ
jgi:hypothetical protein